MTRLLTLAAFAAILPLAPAMATLPTPAQVVVDLGDLDLASARGRSILDRRIQHAAVAVCGPVSDLHLAGQNDVRRCRVETMAAARLRADARLAMRQATIPALTVAALPR